MSLSKIVLRSPSAKTSFFWSNRTPTVAFILSLGLDLVSASYHGDGGTTMDCHFHPRSIRVPPIYFKTVRKSFPT